MAESSREYPESSQADKGAEIQGFDVAQLTPEERDGLMRNLTKLQQLDASGAIEPSLQYHAGKELIRQSQEVATRPLQGGKASLDGAMAHSSSSEIGDPVDLPNIEGMEDGEIPPSPGHEEGEHMEISTEEDKNPENEKDSQPEQGGWQEKLGSREKGYDPSQPQLSWSEGEELDPSMETGRPSRHEREALKKEHARKSTHYSLYKSQTRPR